MHSKPITINHIASSSKGNAHLVSDGETSLLLDCGEGDNMEKWKWVSGWEGIYQISDHGRLKSFKKVISGRILSNKNKTGWYLNVVLAAPGKARLSIKMHKLVALAFIPNPDSLPEINHKDSNKQNNTADNLEWVTRNANMAHAIKNNPRIISGMNNYNKEVRPRPVLQITTDGRILAKFCNTFEAHRNTGVCSRNIHQVASKTEYKPGKTRKQAGGFVWRFDEVAKNG